MATNTISQWVVAFPPHCTQADVTSVAASAIVVTLLAARGTRIGVVIFNDSTSVLMIKLGVAASATSKSYELQPGQYWEMAFNYRYTGVITGIWLSATGSARITEVLE